MTAAEAESGRALSNAWCNSNTPLLKTPSVRRKQQIEPMECKHIASHSHITVLSWNSGNDKTGQAYSLVRNRMPGASARHLRNAHAMISTWFPTSLSASMITGQRIRIVSWTNSHELPSCSSACVMCAMVCRCLFGQIGWLHFWISLSLRPNFRLRPNLMRKVKWHFWFGLSESLSVNFRWVIPWVPSFDSAIRSAKVSLNNAVLA